MSQETPGAIGYIQLNGPQRKKLSKQSQNWTCKMCNAKNSSFLPIDSEIQEDLDVQEQQPNPRNPKSKFNDYLLAACLLLAFAILLNKYLT